MWKGQEVSAGNPEPLDFGQPEALRAVCNTFFHCFLPETEAIEHLEIALRRSVRKAQQLGQLWVSKAHPAPYHHCVARKGKELGIVLDHPLSSTTSNGADREQASPTTLSSSDSWLSKVLQRRT